MLKAFKDFASAIAVADKGLQSLTDGSDARATNTLIVSDAKDLLKNKGQEIVSGMTSALRRLVENLKEGLVGWRPYVLEAEDVEKIKTDLLGNGDLEAVVKREGKFPWLVDREGNWTVRNDVYFQEARLAKDGKGSPLSATSNGRSIGPELGFGHVLGTFHDEQVLLIKTAQGNRSRGFDFRPPSSGRTEPDNMFEAHWGVDIVCWTVRGRPTDRRK